MNASELIVNPDGGIYHLHLKPGELANTVFTVGDPERVPEVSKYFDSIELTRSHREIVTHTGYIGNKRVSVISTGMGTDNIDIVLNEMDALVNIDFATRTVKEELTSLNIIRLGTSGTLQKDIPLDSIVVSEYAIGLDSLLSFYTNSFINDGELMDLDAAISGFLEDNELIFSYYLCNSSNALRSLFLDYKQGITITAPGFYAPQDRHLRLTPVFDNMIPKLAAFSYNGKQFTNLEMETAGIYGLGKLMGHNCLSINAILANRADGTFSTNPAKVVDEMVRMAVERVDALNLC